MKVLIICTEKLPNPPIKGGAIQTYIAGAVPSLSKNHTITILGSDDPLLPEEETISGVHYVRVPGNLLETYRDGVVNYVKKHTFDLIHIFNRPRLVNAVHDVAPDSRIILSMHNDMFKKEKIERREAKKAINCLDKIITISNYIGEEIAKLYPEAKPKLQTIYSGVDLDRFVTNYSIEGRKLGDTLRKKYKLGSKKIILFAGRLSANKGPDVLIHAIKKLAEKHQDIVLVLMGSKGFSDNRMTDYIAYINAITERFPVPVITTGYVQADQIQNWFAAADIFVCPSQWEEPLARVHYEAMAAGLPVITTARGGNPEIIEVNKNGVIVENPEDPQEFVKHLSTLVSNPSICLKMGKYGRSFVEKNHSWDRVVSDISHVWDEVSFKNNNKNGIENATLNNEKPVEEKEIVIKDHKVVAEQDDQEINEQQNTSKKSIEGLKEDDKQEFLSKNKQKSENKKKEEKKEEKNKEKKKKEKKKDKVNKKQHSSKVKEERENSGKQKIKNKKLSYSPFNKERSKNLGFYKNKKIQ